MAIISKNLLDDYLKIDQNFVLTIGNFDGLHIGHQKIILKAINISEANNYQKAVITFSNKPAALFAENYVNTQIFPIKSKIEYFEKFGFDYIFLFEFNSELRNLTADRFLNLLSSNKFLKHIVVGENFVFGKNKTGNQQVLNKYFENSSVKVEVIPLVYENGQLISSTMIRQHILCGDFSINKYLIEPFYIKGLVEAGKHQGRMIQFPTANIYIYDQIRPKPAVYATITAYKKDRDIDKYVIQNKSHNCFFIKDKDRGLNNKSFINNY